MEPKIHLLIVISNLGYGGAERQVVELSNRLDSSKFEVHVCTLSTHRPLAASLESHVHQHVVSKRGKFDPLTILDLSKLIRNIDCHIVHSFLLDAEIASRIAGRVTGIRVIGSERNSRHNYSLPMLVALNATNRLPHLVVANSEAGKQFHQSKFGLPDCRYQVVFNGVDTDRFKPGPSNLATEEFGIPENCTIFGMVGSFKEQKNHVYLIEAVALLAQERTDFRVLLVGAEIQEGDDESISYRDYVLAEMESRGVHDLFVRTPPRNDVEEIYRLCEFTVLPSLYEGTPNVALESMACGTPVVATDVADNATVIPHGEVGCIVPLNEPRVLSDTLHMMIKDQQSRTKMAKAARNWILKNYSTEKMVADMTDVYTKQHAQSRG